MVEPNYQEQLRADYARFLDCLSQIGAIYNAADDTFWLGGEKHDQDSIVQQVVAATRKVNGLDKLSQIPAKAAMSTFTTNERAKAKAEALARVKLYDPTLGESEIRKVVGLLHDCDPQEAPQLDVAALMSMFWQAKRKLAGHLKVAHPICPIFVGGQGFGKNWLLDELFKPVEVFRAGSVSLKKLENEFNLRAFNRWYIIPFDEMSSLKVKDFDHDVLKNLITEAYYTFRDPHGKAMFKLENVATCYGTSNYTIEHILPEDSTGRRWWEIVVPDRAWSAKDAARLAQIDPVKLWHSVDGNSPTNPRTPFLEIFRAAQKQRRMPTELEQFVERHFRQSPGSRLSLSDIHAQYMEWLRSQNALHNRRIMVSAIQDELKALGYEFKNHGGRHMLTDITWAED